MNYEKKAPKGAGVFIWQPKYCEGGDWGKIIAKAQEAKLGWVALHNFYSQAAIRQLKDAGLYVAYSQYWAPTNSTACTASAVNALTAGADGLLLDMEIEWEGKNHEEYERLRDTAISMFTKLKAAVGDAWLANAGAWAYPKAHGRYPDTVISRYVDAAMPERYWTEQYATIPCEIELNGSEKQWREDPDVKNYKTIIPIGSGYGTNTSSPGGHQPLTQGDFQEFVIRQETFGVWSWLHLPEFAWDVLKSRVGV